MDQSRCIIHLKCIQSYGCKSILIILVVWNLGRVFAPAENYIALRMIFATVSQQNFDLLQLEMWYYFLNGPLKEEKYVLLPEVFEKIGNWITGDHQSLHTIKLGPYAEISIDTVF